MSKEGNRGLVNRLWGIYYADREYAKVMGDPIGTVIEVPTKLTAEEAAAQLGFGEARAQPITSDQAQQAQWLPESRPGHRKELTHAKHPSGRV